MQRLADAMRRLRDDPTLRLESAGIREGMKVADIGAGYGYFAFPMAAMVGKEGMVYAVEPNPERAKKIVQVAAENEVKNIVVVTSSAEEMAEIPAGSVDLAISMSSFHHFGDPERALSEIRRIVRPSGVVYIRDMKLGRIMRHGSRSESFRREVVSVFPDAEFEETSGHITARIRVPSA